MSLIIIQALLQSYIKHDKSMDPLKIGVLKLIYKELYIYTFKFGNI
jgi:hypothetical protein